jgi:transposase
MSHRPRIVSGMLVRYRYRLDPTPSQRQALARAFGCARVVYNDALYERERAHQTSKQLSDTEVQRRVITLAKQTPERAWLTEVASVVLVQACQDARRAYRKLVRLSVGQAPRTASRAPQVPDQTWPPVDPADPQRLRPARD